MEVTVGIFQNDDAPLNNTEVTTGSSHEHFIRINTDLLPIFLR